jgi:predicted outer membrane repeat protein
VSAAPRAFAFAAATVLVLALPLVVRGATRLVPQQFATIGSALAASSPGDTVLVSCGTYFEHSLSLKSGVTIRSTSGNPACVTVDAAGLGRVFDAVEIDSTARLEGLTIKGGNATQGAFYSNIGGGLRCVQSHPRVRDCIFTGNVAKFGGAVGCERSGPSLIDCTFQDNQASSNDWAAGGALYCRFSSPIVITNGSFVSNEVSANVTPADGGAIFSDESRIEATDCTFTGNSAQAGAGGFYSFDRDISVFVRCTFTANVANAGGAMYLETSWARFIECVFQDNSASNGGGVFMAQTSRPHFNRCEFLSNEANPFAGGGLDSFHSDSEILDCTFIGNSAQTFGGALRFDGPSEATIDRAVIRGNTAGSLGGGIHLAGTATATITNSTIHGNAGPSGGGISLAGSAQAAMSRVLITGSTVGAAVSCAGSSSATLFECNNFGNAGGNWTGCIASQQFLNANLSADPLYCDAPNGVLTLTLPDSPCLPENTVSGETIGRLGEGCGCPANTTVRVPDDFPTIAAAIAAAQPGDVIGICSGDYDETISIREGVHLVGARANLTRVFTTGSAASALLTARSIQDSTLVSDLTLDAASILPNTVRAESTTTGLHLERTKITGASSWGIVNGPDSRIRLNGGLDGANDIFANGGALLRFLKNENTSADSLDALLNYWGTTNYAVILDALEGPILSCPITDSTHTKVLCAPLSALPAPLPPSSIVRLSTSPNPFQESVAVVFTLTRPVAEATLQLHDVRGRRIRTLPLGPREPGTHRVVWDRREERGTAAAPGIYFVRLLGCGAPQGARIVRLR